LSPRERFLAALNGEAVAFAPIVWDRLPALVRQERADWWQDPSTGQRLIADAAGVAAADAMFVCVAREAVLAALAQGPGGDATLDSLSTLPEAERGIELVRVVREIAGHGVIAPVPAPTELQRALHGDEPEAAEDAFTDLVSAYLGAGADAIAVTGGECTEVAAGLERAAALGGLFGRPVVAICTGHVTSAWDERGVPLGVISATGEWPAGASGVVITPGDVSARWDAARLRAVGTTRP
jgi:hypothetical protein